jgi:hypothetical protein
VPVPPFAGEPAGLLFYANLQLHGQCRAITAAAAGAAAAQVRVPVTKRASPALLLALRSYTNELLKGGLRFWSTLPFVC